VLDLKGIESTMEKLRRENGPGEIEYISKGRDELRYAYYLNEKMAFTFGLTRSSKKKSKMFYYVPRQMGITNGEYRKLHECPWKKRDLNQKLIESGIV